MDPMLMAKSQRPSMNPGNKSIDYHIQDGLGFVPDKTNVPTTKYVREIAPPDWTDNLGVEAAGFLPVIGNGVNALRTASKGADFAYDVASGNLNRAEDNFSSMMNYGLMTFMPMLASSKAGALKAGVSMGEYNERYVALHGLNFTPNYVNKFYSPKQAERVKGMLGALATGVEKNIKGRLFPSNAIAARELGLNVGDIDILREQVAKYDKIVESTGKMIDNKLRVPNSLHIETRKAAKIIEGQVGQAILTKQKFNLPIPDELKKWGATYLEKQPDGVVPKEFFGRLDGLVDPQFNKLGKMQMNSHARAVSREKSVNDLMYYAHNNVDAKTLAKAIPGARIENGKYILELVPKGKPHFLTGSFPAQVVVNPMAKAGEPTVMFKMYDINDIGGNSKITSMIKPYLEGGIKHDQIVYGSVEYNYDWVSQPTIAKIRAQRVATGARIPRKSPQMEKDIDDMIAQAIENEEKLHYTSQVRNAPIIDMAKKSIEKWDEQIANSQNLRNPKELFASIMFAGHNIPGGLYNQDRLANREAQRAEQVKRLGANNDPYVVMPARSNPGLLNFMK